MNLASRLAAAQGRPAAPEAPAAPSVVPQPRPVTPALSATLPAPPTDALTRLKDRVAKALFERMGNRMNDPSLSEEQLRAVVLGELDEVVEEERVSLSADERVLLTAELCDDDLGLCPLQWLLDDL